MAQVQLLELQAQRMKKLVEQRKQERADMELENVRMERQLKYLAEMSEENKEVEAEYQRQQAGWRPLIGPEQSRYSPLIGGTLLCWHQGPCQNNTPLRHTMCVVMAYRRPD